MSLDDKLTCVAVVGAGGKMGSGITFLLAQQMAMAKLRPENRDKHYRLVAIDVNDCALEGLIGYIRSQALKSGEKTTVMLRNLYADRTDLVENGEIIEQFVNDVVSILRPTTCLEQAAGAHLVFEAVLEKIDLKLNILKKLDVICGPDTFYFTNTSSIPIRVMDEQVKLGGRIIGYHFYNPPAVQKLVEVISNPQTRPELVALSNEIGKLLRKTLINSNDIAGFIGNGHFIRDGLHALAEVSRIQGEFTQPGAIMAVNKVTQELLIRPMGIFQLLDYVGIEVFQWICDVMNEYIPGAALGHDLLKSMLAKDICGGQNSDGSQKDGFLKYIKNRPAGVYDLNKGAYISFDNQEFIDMVTKKLGDFPTSLKPWKSVLSIPDRDVYLRDYFNALQQTRSTAAELAVTYMKKSREIGQKLITDKVADSADNVNGIMLNGFFHAYGPINDFIS